MTDPRPICPIPPDARVGDIVVFRDGQRKEVTAFTVDDSVIVQGVGPGFVSRDGSAFFGSSRYDCISFEYVHARKKPKPKPKRTQAQRDAAFIRSRVDSWRNRAMTIGEHERMKKIADRLEGKT